VYAAVLRGVGNTALAFRVALVSNAINVAVNYCLILGNFGFPALGVQGAAFGTVIAFSVSVGLMVHHLRHGAIPGLDVRFRLVNPDRPMLRELWGIGAPAALDMVILNAGFLAIVGMLGRLEEVAVAAHGVGLRVQALAFVPGMSISQAAGAMIGNALGAGNQAEARRTVWAGVAMCTGVMTGLGLLFIVAAEPIVHIFKVHAGSALEMWSVRWMVILGVAMLPVGIWIGFVGMLSGSGATRTSLRINALSTLLVQIPVGWLLGFPLGMGPTGVWMGLPIAFTLKALLGYGAYRRGLWARTGVTLDDAPEPQPG
jgi:putative MATE family efflux protein